MRLIKVFVLALSAVCITVVALGAGSAVASEGTVLCVKNENPCQPKNRVLAPITFNTELAEESEAVLVSELGSIACKGSSMAIEMTSESEVLSGKVTSFSLSECQYEEETACTVAPTGLPYLAEMKATESGDGTLTAANGGSGKPALSINCGPEIKCTFSGEPVFRYDGGKPAQIIAEEVEMASTAPCPAIGKLTATYTSSSSGGSETYLTSGKSTLCTKEEEVCASGNTYPSGTEVEATSSGATFELQGSTTFSCGSSSLEFQTTGKAEQPLPVQYTTLVFGSCNNNCSATATGLPINGSIRAVGEGDGRLKVEELTFKIKCLVPAECVYRKTVILKLEGNSSTPTILASNEPLDYVSGLLCPTTLYWSASYSVVEPTPLFVSG